MFRKYYLHTELLNDNYFRAEFEFRFVYTFGIKVIGGRVIGIRMEDK